MSNFTEMGLSPTLLASLAKMNYSTPTPVQEQAIPVALKGHDIMGSAQTGTGKTAAFAIPLVEKLLLSPRGSGLILTPTRELGKQILDILHQLLGHKSAIRTAFLIGGEPMGRQISDLRQRPRLIVGTPGRVFDHLERGNLMLHDTNYLVLDETDRMLDIGFSVQLEKIFKFLPAQRQTLMFSATLPKNIIKLSEKYLNDPVRIAVGSTHTPSKNITQEVIRVSEDKKYDVLLSQLYDRNGSVIIFVKTKIGADKLTAKLRKADFEAEALHGDLRQSRRNNVIRDFRNKKYRILVATDVAARGLDIPHIEHVINYDLPQVPEDYIHRIGRTARAGAEGAALCLLTPQDGRKWHAIELLINPEKRHEKPKSERSFKSSGGKSFGDDRGKSNKRFRPSFKKKFGDRDESGFDAPRAGPKGPRHDAQTQSEHRAERTSDFKTRERPSFDKKRSGERSEGFGARRDEARGERAPKRDYAPRGDRAPRQDGARGERAPRQDYAPRSDRAPRQDSVRGERAPRQDYAPRGDRAPRQDGARSERAPRQDYAPRGDRAPRQDGARSERAPRQDRFRADKPKGNTKPFQKKRDDARGNAAPARTTLRRRVNKEAA